MKCLQSMPWNLYFKRMWREGVETSKLWIKWIKFFSCAYPLFSNHFRCSGVMVVAGDWSPRNVQKFLAVSHIYVYLYVCFLPNFLIRIFANPYVIVIFLLLLYSYMLCFLWEFFCTYVLCNDFSTVDQLTRGNNIVQSDSEGGSNGPVSLVCYHQLIDTP
jgi:hypothetical protein